mgnify:CR=1 FL=1
MSKKKDPVFPQAPLADATSQIVVSSRVRLARNLRERPFPGVAKRPVLIAVMEEVKAAVAGLSEMEAAFVKKL